MWLDGAPMVFLVISAVAFIIGLNLFAYLSYQVRQPPQSLLIQNHDMKQPRYVSLSTNILTGLLGSCILVVTSWFVYRLEYESKRVQRLRTFFTWPYLYHLRRTFHWYVRSFLDELKADRASVGRLETINA